MRTILLKAAFAIALVAPTVAAALYSTWPAATAGLATLTYAAPTLKDAEWDDGEKVLSMRREAQRHFLRHGIYIPMEDIVAPMPHDLAAGPLALVMQKACGRGRLYIWIPFKFRLPVAGERVIEWCWKPQPKEPSA
jgi:hypothetical protein